MQLRSKTGHDVPRVQVIQPELETREAQAAQPVVDFAEAAAAARIRRALHETAEYLRLRVHEYMPPSPFREYYLWGLDPANPDYELWLQISGLRQIVELSCRVTDMDFDDELFYALSRYAMPLNVYLNFEIVSDDLAFGLMDRQPGDTTFDLRAHVVHTYNNAICRRLRGDQRHGHDVLSIERGIADRVSNLVHTLSPLKHRKLAEHFLDTHPAATLSDLEHGLYSLLVANFEACADLSQTAEALYVGPLVKRGLYRRYASADLVLRDQHLQMPQLLSLSTYTILILPVVSFYLEGLADAVGVRDRLPAAMRDQLVFKNVYLTALLIRLLNDLGTNVIVQSDAERAALTARLRRQAARGHYRSMRDFLRDTVNDHGAVLTRIAKDVEKGEFNMSLYKLDLYDSVDDALVVFGRRLDYFAHLYGRSMRRLENHLGDLAQRLGHVGPSTMLMRAVRFHERVYAHSYSGVAGDFAV